MRKILDLFGFNTGALSDFSMILRIYWLRRKIEDLNSTKIDISEYAFFYVKELRKGGKVSGTKMWERSEN